jgi:hypothetical protein
MDAKRWPDAPDAADAADDGPPAEPIEDRAAILSRRAFLIESALAGVGLGVGVAGCDRPAQDGAPLVCLSKPVQRPDAGAAGVGGRPVGRPCLSVRRVPRDGGVLPGELRPNVCLSISREARETPGILKVLKQPAARDAGAPPAPRACLSPPVRPPKPGT